MLLLRFSRCCFRDFFFQDTLASFWGKAEAASAYEQLNAQWERQLFDEHRQIQIARLISVAAFPVYGLTTNALDFSLRSLSVWSFSNDHRLRSLGCKYASPRYVHPLDNFELRSSDARWENITNSWEVLAHIPDLAPDFQLFRRYHFSLQQQQQAGDPTIWCGHLTIADSSFAGEIRHWSYPSQLNLFLFKSVETILNGTAHSLSVEELLYLLQRLVVINHRDDLLVQYQRALEGGS